MFLGDDWVLLGTWGNLVPTTQLPWKHLTAMMSRHSLLPLSAWTHVLGILFFIPVEWRLFSLRLLSETTTLLVSQELEDGDEEASCDSDSSLLALLRDELLPQ